jgi:hypothetical protein
MELTAQYVLGELEKHAEVLRGFGVKRIGLFGSVARGESRKDSDLDFLVELSRLTFEDYTALLLYLDDLFGKPVDAVLVQDLRPEWREGVLSEVVYAGGV